MNYPTSRLAGFIKAVTGLSRALELAIKDFIEEFPEFLNSMAEGYQTSMDHLDDFSRKERLLKKFVAKDKIVFGKRCVYRVHGLWSLAEFYRENYRLGEAQSIFLLCADLLFSEADSEPKLPFEFRRRIIAISDFLADYSKYEQAEAMLRRCLDKAPAATDKEKIEDLQRLAHLCAKNGKRAEAVLCLTAVRDLSEPLLGPDSPALTDLLEKHRRLLKELADEEALRQCTTQLALLDAVVINDRALGQDHPANEKPLRELARYYAGKGKHDLAELLSLRANIAYLANKTKNASYPGLARDLRELAKYYRARAEGGDGTLAFHADRKADLLAAKRR